MADGKARRYHNRLFILPRLDKPTYTLLQDLRVAHGNASQWEIISAALVAYAKLDSVARESYLADFRGKAPSDTLPHEVAP